MLGFEVIWWWMKFNLLAGVLFFTFHDPADCLAIVITRAWLAAIVAKKVSEGCGAKLAIEHFKVRGSEECRMAESSCVAEFKNFMTQVHHIVC